MDMLSIRNSIYMCLENNDLRVLLSKSNLVRNLDLHFKHKKVYSFLEKQTSGLMRNWYRLNS